MKIPYCYCDIKNFGDRLNPLIFKHFTGFDIVKDNDRFAEVIGIGSILDGVVKNDEKASVSDSPLNVFSSGFGFDTIGKTKRKLRVFAVRGKLTLSKLKKMKNVEFVYKNTPCGDAGLLASYIVSDNVDKCFEIGVVPHYADKNNPIFQKINDNFKGKSIILDPTEDPIKFLHDLQKCKAVISTAMHPLIACDALRIPNMWVRISETTTSRYKFYDYYSVFGIDKEPYDLSKGFDIDDIDKIYNEYNITDKDIKNVQKKLISALYDIKKLLIADIDNVKNRRINHAITRFILKLICGFIPIKRVRRILRNKY